LNKFGKYTYGDNFRIGYLSGDKKLVDQSSELYTFCSQTGLSTSMGYILD